MSHPKEDVQKDAGELLLRAPDIRWRCKSCIYYPPSSFGEKPCSFCWEGDPYMDCYVQKEEPED